ncbi:MAG: EF-P beta-lysylation protein EpmB [Steroidobacteraceae bacterium]
MIAAEPKACHTAAVPDWQQELARAVRDPVELLELLGLTPGQIGPFVSAESLRAAAADFPLRVPHSFIGRMRHGDARDPLLRQVLCVPEELLAASGYVADPLHEATARGAPGLLQKYQGRALLITTGACAVHCRYCFRRHYDYSADQADDQPRWTAALQAIAADLQIDEVILSGGDPLSLGNARLAHLVDRIGSIEHVRRIRVHTRTPIVLPSRVDAGLCEALSKWRERLVIVVHANHPHELNAPVMQALRQLGAAATAVLNQAVLLTGVNDNASTLAQLSRRLFEGGVLPYYLHQLDQVAGAAHFAVSDDQAILLHQALIATLPGYLVPRLVRELPGASGKTPIFNGNSGLP